jgi:hypothetical protein
VHHLVQHQASDKLGICSADPSLAVLPYWHCVKVIRAFCGPAPGDTSRSQCLKAPLQVLKIQTAASNRRVVGTPTLVQHFAVAQHEFSCVEVTRVLTECAETAEV